jgi:hypothetical protein
MLEKNKKDPIGLLEACSKNCPPTADRLSFIEFDIGSSSFIESQSLGVVESQGLTVSEP